MSDLGRLATKRVLLASGLFDAAFYRATYADLRTAPVDPLTHYLTQGEAEGRSPNAVFLPAYYRRHAMAVAPAEQNALAHYAEEGEPLGYRPHPAFDPSAYLAANPALAGFVDRPLFHYLRIGRAAGLPVAAGQRGAALARVLEAQRDAHAVAASGGRDHRALMRYKRVLVGELGIAEAFAVFRAVLGTPDSARIDRLPIAGLRQFAEARAAAFHEIAPAGDGFVVAPPRIVGADAEGGFTGTSRGSFLACLIDARVRPRSAVIEAGGMALLDGEDDERSAAGDMPEFDPAVFDADATTLWLTGPEHEGATIELDEGFTLLGPHSDDFDRWMLEHLARYLAASMSGALPPVPVLIDQRLPATHRQCLELMLPAGVDIVALPPGAVARVRRLWCAANLLHLPLSRRRDVAGKWEIERAPPVHFAALAREMVRRAEPVALVPTGQQRIYLARQRPARQLLANRCEIEAVAAARGFAIVDPDEFGFDELVRLLRHAAFVIAEERRDLIAAWFAPRGARLCYLSDPYTSELGFRTSVLDELGVEATVYAGLYARPSARHAGTYDFRIERQPFGEFLDRWAPRDDAAAPAAKGSTATIFSYWDKPDITPVKTFVEHWRQHFPAFQMISDLDVEPLIEEIFPQYLELYRKTRFAECKSAVALLLWLYKTGGLYVDCHCGIRDVDAVHDLLAALEHWELILYDRSRVAEPRPASHLRPLNSVLFARPRSAIVWDALLRVFAHLAAKRSAEQEHGFEPYWLSLLTVPGVLYETLLVDPEAAFSRLKPEYEGRVRFIPEGPGEPIGRDMDRSWRVPGMHWSEREEREFLFD